MGLHAVEGDVGGGKSFIAVHDLMAGYLRDTSRPVYTNLPVDGAQLEYYLCWLSRNAAKREAMRRRLHFLRSGPQVAFYDYWVDPRLEGEPERYRDDEGRCLALPGEVSWPEDEETEAEYRDFGFERRRRQLPELHD
ncbi:MAG TPA: hypothetical protein VHO48_09980, partial [Anaerolineaceae bacterium]|nr:hypothetical protein [Anaerolineaceae bacterium]